MKKICGLFLLLVCLIIYASYAYADSNLNKDFENTAKSIVKVHLMNIDHNTESMYNKASAELTEYLKVKEASIEHFNDKYNYNIETSVVEYENLGDATYIEVNAKVEFGYGAVSADSGYAKNVEVLIDNETGRAIDLYERDRSFDLSIRGEVDIKNKEDRLTGEIVEYSKSVYKYEDSKSESEAIVGGVDEPTDVYVIPKSLVINIWIGIGIFSVIALGVVILMKVRNNKK